MNLLLKPSRLKTGKLITITGSKSESNRLLLLRALYPELNIHNISNSDDSRLMTKAVQSEEKIIDIHHAGTAMRFLTAYFSIQKGRETILTGSERMKERPIKILVEALRSVGAYIEYMEKEGYPPLLIKGKDISTYQLSINANVSSQYISALLLIGAKLKNGLEVELIGNITSWPYINMTIQLLEKLGISVSINGQVIKVFPLDQLDQTINITVESDWSSASYYYSLIAMSEIGTEIRLRSYRADSLQGDSDLTKLYRPFGVATRSEDDSILISKTTHHAPEVEFDLKNTPDLAQTIAATCLGLEMGCKLKGLHTLKIKETDRLEALRTEMAKLGARVEITGDSLELYPSELKHTSPEIETYNDHRMAMAFAPLALKTSLIIKEAGVVSKSYPDFWTDMESMGIDFDSLK